MHTRSLLKGAALGLAGLMALAGCPAPEERFNEFIERHEASEFNQQGSGGGDVCASEAPMMGERDGVYLFTFLPTDPSSDGVPAPFQATITVTGSELELELLALDATDRTSVAQDSSGVAATPQTFPAAGDEPFVITPDGVFEIGLTGVNVPSTANPLTDSDLVVDAVLSGAFCSEPGLLCGSFEAQVTSLGGLAVSGTWAMTAEDMGAFAEPPPVNCAGDLAAPL